MLGAWCRSVLGCGFKVMERLAPGAARMELQSRIRRMARACPSLTWGDSPAEREASSRALAHLDGLANPPRIRRTFRQILALRGVDLPDNPVARLDAALAGQPRDILSELALELGLLGEDLLGLHEVILSLVERTLASCLQHDLVQAGTALDSHSGLPESCLKAVVTCVPAQAWHQAQASFLADASAVGGVHFARFLDQREVLVALRRAYWEQVGVALPDADPARSVVGAVSRFLDGDDSVVDRSAMRRVTDARYSGLTPLACGVVLDLDRLTRRKDVFSFLEVTGRPSAERTSGTRVRRASARDLQLLPPDVLDEVSGIQRSTGSSAHHGHPHRALGPVLAILSRAVLGRSAAREVLSTPSPLRSAPGQLSADLAGADLDDILPSLSHDALLIGAATPDADHAPNVLARAAARLEAAAKGTDSHAVFASQAVERARDVLDEARPPQVRVDAARSLLRAAALSHIGSVLLRLAGRLPGVQLDTARACAAWLGQKAWRPPSPCDRVESSTLGVRHRIRFPPEFVDADAGRPRPVLELDLLSEEHDIVLAATCAASRANALEVLVWICSRWDLSRSLLSLLAPGESGDEDTGAVSTLHPVLARTSAQGEPESLGAFKRRVSAESLLPWCLEEVDQALAWGASSSEEQRRTRAVAHDCLAEDGAPGLPGRPWKAAWMWRELLDGESADQALPRIGRWLYDLPRLRALLLGEGPEGGAS